MSARSVLEAIAAVCREVPGVVDVPDWAPDDLNEGPAMRLYVAPGETTANQHSSRSGGPVVSHRDTIAIEWHTLDKRTAAALEAATDALDALRTLLWAAFIQGRLPEVTELHRIYATDFGQLGWGGADTFGFRFLVDLSHRQAIPGANRQGTK